MGEETKLQPTDTQFIAEIAAALGETEPAPLAQLGRLIKVLGPDASRALLTEVEQIEASGGMMLGDKSRRRTPGGVYFHLARKRLPTRDRRYVFPFPKQGKHQKQGTDQPATPAAPPVTWADRGPLVEEAAQAPGRISTVKMTIIGRPNRVVERDGFTLALLTYAGPLPSLPKGIPTPPKVPETRYICYIGAKQWRTVKDALKQADDVLIAEGTPIYDPDYKAIAVFCTSVTTKQLQAAKRQGDKAKTQG